MSDNRRLHKFEKTLREVVSSYLITGFREPLPVMVSVPMVRATKDFKSAKVYVSFFGKNPSENQKSECIAILNENAFDVQRHVASQMPMKSCPKLKFFGDEAQQEAMKVQNLIDKVAQERNNQE